MINKVLSCYRNCITTDLTIPSVIYVTLSTILPLFIQLKKFVNTVGPINILIIYDCIYVYNKIGVHSDYQICKLYLLGISISLLSNFSYTVKW